jgi:hypothetical protein
VIATTVCLLLAGCGAGGEPDRTDRLQAGPTQPGGLGAAGAGVDLNRFTTLEADTQWEVAAVAAPGAVAVVEGAATLDQGLRPVLHVAKSGQPSLERFPLPLDQPLFNVSAFWNGSEVVIVGLSCPSWTDAAKPPAVDEEILNTFSSECAEDRYVAMGWNLETGKFRPISETVLEVGSGIYLQDSAGPHGLFALGGGEFVTFNSTDGSAFALPQIEVDGVVERCVAQDGTVYAIAIWGGPTPSRGEGTSVPAEWADQVVSRPDGQRLAALRLEGLRWRTVEVRGELLPGELFPIGCADGAAVIAAQNPQARQRALLRFAEPKPEDTVVTQIPETGLPPAGLANPLLSLATASGRDTLLAYLDPATTSLSTVYVLRDAGWELAGQGEVKGAPITLVTAEGILVYPPRQPSSSSRNPEPFEAIVP